MKLTYQGGVEGVLGGILAGFGVAKICVFENDAGDRAAAVAVWKDGEVWVYGRWPQSKDDPLPGATGDAWPVNGELEAQLQIAGILA